MATATDTEQSRRILCVGICVLDVIHVVEQYPVEDTDKRCVAGYWQRGGNASNNCTVLCELGAPAIEFLGFLSASVAFGFLNEDSRKRGIILENCPITDMDPPFSSVILNNATGSRTIIHSNPGFPSLDYEHLSRLQLNKYCWIHFEGRNPESILKCIHNIRYYNNLLENSKNRIRISVDLEKIKDEILVLGEAADYVFLGKDLALHLGWTKPEEAVMGLYRRLKPQRELNDAKPAIICPWGAEGAGCVDPQAVTTWIILCYFKQIEQQREEQMTVEVHMNNAFEENIKPNACFENYDIYLNFLAVFACIYALAKVTSVAESYVAHQVNARLKHARFLSSEHMEPTTIEEIRVHNLRLTMHIDFLEKENAKLEQKIKQLEQTNFMLGGNSVTNTSALNGTVKTYVDDTKTDQQTNNNKALPNGMPHTCICTERGSSVGSVDRSASVVRNGGLVLNNLVGGNENKNMNMDGIDERGMLRFRDISIRDQYFQLTEKMPTWKKYLEMQKHAIQMPTASEAAAEVANTLPAVVSTEELQTMKGTEQQRGKRQPRRTRSPISTTTLTRKLRYYQTSLHQAHHKHISHTTLALPIKIFYKNLFVCLLCLFL
ncbi:uncharacterized protein [Eurosta solidaginis]|uniref:uncharacterized protein isoform X2 n=1 Tax=Eurosta solidaginis TaxID=178769 RepID=UPI00353067DF